MPFICIIDTVCQGRVASWRDEDGRPIVYPTQADAEEDANDVNLPPDDPDYDPDDLNEPDTVVEVVVTDESIVDAVDGRVYWTKGFDPQA